MGRDHLRGRVGRAGDAGTRGASAVRDVSHQAIAGGHGQADSAQEQDQQPDDVKVRRDQPERANYQPEQDDQRNRAHVPHTPLRQAAINVSTHTPGGKAVHIARRALRGMAGCAEMGTAAARAAEGPGHVFRAGMARPADGSSQWA